MRRNLLKLIKDEEDITNTIILTHNIDFIFFQSVLLPAFKQAGHPKITIFADAQCATETFSIQSMVIDSIGLRYRVVPILMEQGFRFHPKAILLSGTERAKLFVGSGNLTFGGWIQNAEAWSMSDTEIDGTAHFTSFKEYLQKIVALIQFPDIIQSEINECYDINNHPWAINLDEPSGLVGKAGSGPTLKEQFISIIGNQQIMGITICSPFFDTKANALIDIVKSFGNPETKVFIQNSHTTMTKTGASNLPSNITLLPIGFTHTEEDGNEREGYVHEKFYAFEHEDSFTVFSGSANCSNAALLIPGSLGNAELMTVQNFSKNDFHRLFTEEIQLLETELILTDPAEPEKTDKENPTIQITHASFEAGKLIVGYRCSEEIKLSKCIVDDNSVTFNKISSKELVADIPSFPRFLKLEGVFQGAVIKSNLSWIDHEHELRSTARGRQLSDTIRQKVNYDYWSVGAWNEILDVFYKDLQYIPLYSRNKNIEPGRKEKNKSITYSEADIFSSQYGLTTLSSTSTNLTPDLKLSNIQQLLFRWFGYGNALDGDNPDPDSPGEDGEEDKPAPIPKKVKPRKAVEVTEADHRKSKKTIFKLTEQICSPGYLESQPPEIISSHLKFMVVLFLIGVREKWITENDFAVCSYQIWCALFFKSKKKLNIGWIEYRKQQSEDSEDFIQRFISLELSSALSVWALKLPFDFSSMGKTIFSLSCMMSVARLPEIWITENCNDIATEIQNNLLHLIFHEPGDDQAVENFKKQWLLLVRMGFSIRAFEDMLSNYTVLDIKDKITQKMFLAGELLWQGKRGFCINLKNVHKKYDQYAEVISLQDAKRSITISSDFLIPIKSILGENESFFDISLGSNNKRYLSALCNTIKKNIKLSGDSWYTA